MVFSRHNYNHIIDFIRKTRSAIRRVLGDILQNQGSFLTISPVGDIAPVISPGYKRLFSSIRLFTPSKILIPALFVFFLFMLNGSVSVTEAASTVFHIDSAYGVKKDSTVIIDVFIENPHDLWGCYFELEYDPHIVSAAHVIRGKLSSGYKTFDPDLNAADEGRISVLWSNDSGNVLSDDGVLCRIYFTVEEEGSTVLAVRKLDLFDSGAYSSIINGYISTAGHSDSLEIVTGAYLPGANRNSYYSTALKARGGTASYKWSQISGSLPPGLKLSSLGVISGTPTTTGKYTITIRLTDGDGNIARKNFTITVYGTGRDVLTITSNETLSRGRKGVPYSFSLKADGGSKPYTWSRVKGSLPPGLRFSSSGVISGTPTSKGTYTFTARVTDYDYERQEKEFSITVTETGPMSADEALFQKLTLTRSTMELILVPDNMPYTMLVDNDINWINLTVVLENTADYLRVNGFGTSSAKARTIPLSTGTNQVSIAVSPDGHYFRDYALTIYRLP